MLPMPAKVASSAPIAVPTSQPRAGRVLYLTFDGILQPLGRSQVLRYVEGLAACGHQLTLLTLEAESMLAQVDAVARVRKELRQRGIDWVCLRYYSGGRASNALKNCMSAFQAARRLIRRDRITLIHARSYVPAAVAAVLQLTCGVPYLFDMRGYWIDERLAEGRWFTSPRVYAAAKRVEQFLVQHASALVTLTQIQADDLRAGPLKHRPGTPVVVIPTCADYDEFTPAPSASDAVPSDVRQRLRGKLVIGLVGSLNASYCIEEGLSLFRLLLEKRPDAHLLCLTLQEAEIRKLLDKHHLPPCACTVASVAHRDMRAWLPLMDWGLLLLEEGYAKRGSVPTKLAEFLACGVRPVQYGCNPEISEKVREAGSGMVLNGLSPTDLGHAADMIAATPLLEVEVALARRSSRAYFGLESGIQKYETLLTTLLSGGGR